MKRSSWGQPDPKKQSKQITVTEGKKTYTVNWGKETRTKSKYQNKTKTYNGKTYDSIKEAQYAEELDWRIKAGDIKEWFPQFKIPLAVNGIHIANYYVDFKVIDKHGGVEFHEVKGMELPLWIMKWKLLTALIDQIEPGAALIVIK